MFSVYFQRWKHLSLDKHFAAMALFPLQRTTGGGAVVLSAGYCGEGKVAEQPQAGKVGFD